jgi:hypothetical protein
VRREVGREARGRRSSYAGEGQLSRLSAGVAFAKGLRVDGDDPLEALPGLPALVLAHVELAQVGQRLLAPRNQ